jgi:CHAT domain-containing protein/Tfp pilus assembly protein PilF
MLKALILTAAVLAPIGTVTIAPAPELRAFQPSNVAAPPTAAAVAFARELMDAADDEARRVLLDGRAALVTIDLTRALLEEGTRLLQKGTHDRALVAYRLARTVAERAHQPIGVAASTSRIAQTLSSLGDYDQALTLLRESEAIYRELKDRRAELQILNNQAIVHRLRGDLDAALAIQRRVLAAREVDGDPATLAVTLNNIGVLQQGRGEYRDALASMQRALGYRKPGSPEYASTLHNLGTVYYAQGDLPVARDYCERALAVPGIDAQLTMNALTFLAEIARKQGDLEAAERYAQREVEFAEKSGAKPMLSPGLRVLGLILSDRGRQQEARALGERSVSVARTLDSPDVLGQALVALGTVLIDDREYGRALAAADEARALGESLNARSRASAAHVAGLAHAGLGRPQDARRAFETAIADIEALREQVSGAAVERQQFLEANVAPYHSLIDLLIEQGQFDEALHFAERARARTLLDVVERGHVTLDRWLTPAEREQERSLERKLRVLQRNAPAVSAAPTSTPAAAAPQAATRTAKSAPAAATPSSPTAPRPAASAATASASAAGASDTGAADTLGATRRELAALRTRLFAAHPELRLARGEALVPERAELSKAIVDPSTAVLAYTVTGRHVWLFVITAKTMNVYPLKVDVPALTARVRKFREAIATRDLGFAPEAWALYDDLIGPAAAAALKGKTRLILIPDGALWELPFQALRSPARRYLLEDADIAYAPSLTFLYARHMRARVTTAIAPPPPLEPSRDEQRSSRGGLKTARSGQLARGEFAERVRFELLAFGNPTLAAHEAAAFKPLPSAETQARRIAALYPADRTLALIGADAREATVKRDAGRYRVLHFATHGVVDDGNPLYSALLLAEGPDAASAGQDAGEDGRLEARELMDIPLDADLVVLSACDTARGRIGAGEGVVGLSWAILLAGSASTVVSQWQVDAESTSSLMIGFHHALLNRTAGPTRVSTALRRASLDLMRDPRYKHPFYWASFRVVGAP